MNDVPADTLCVQYADRIVNDRGQHIEPFLPVKALGFCLELGDVYKGGCLHGQQSSVLLKMDNEQQEIYDLLYS